MIQNYIKVAVRNLLRNKVYVLINTAGMGIAVACCMAAYLLIAFNVEFDSYFQPSSVRNVVKVVQHYETSAGESDKTLVVPMVMAPLASQEVAGIEEFTRFFNESVIVSVGEKAFYENMRFADASFFRMFDLGLRWGSQMNLDNPNHVFLSETLSKKYFGNDDPTGKTIKVEISNNTMELLVGGVFEKLPLNISFNIDALMRIEPFLKANNMAPGDWGARSSSTLFRLADIHQRKTIGSQLDKYARSFNESQREIRVTSFDLVPFTTPIINGEVVESNLHLPIPMAPLVIFSLLGLIILLIACFNLTNTTLALTGKRLKEIAVRKVIGSARSMIVYQFLVEIGITVSLAVATGFVVAMFLVPQFALMWQLQYGLSDLNALNLMLALIMLLFLASLLAGLNPALANSKLAPTVLLKGGRSSKGTNFLTRSLLVIQFSLSGIVFIAGIVFTQNASYQKSLPMGYDRDHLLAVSVGGEQDFDRFKNAVSENPEILALCGAANHIGPYSGRRSTIRLDTTHMNTRMYEVSPDYFDVVGLKILSGRGFSTGSQADLESAVVDENFIRNHRLNDLDEQIFYLEKPYRIIGVVNNHISGLKQRDNAEHVYRMAASADYKLMVVRADADKLHDVRNFLEKEWKRAFPGKPFECRLQEDIVFEEANGYNNNLTKIFLFITVLGCLLSASGIYALAGLNVQRRKKEIGVRKVLGASVKSIVNLINREFAVILALAGILGGAGGFLLTEALLANLFYQHIPVEIFTVIACSVAVFVVGISTTSGTILKAANSNPTETLKND